MCTIGWICNWCMGFVVMTTAPNAKCQRVLVLALCLVTFRVSRRRREMYNSGHACLCLCVCLPLAAFPDYCSDPDVTWRNGRGCPLVVHYRADFQSLHGSHCYYNIARTRNVSQCLYSLYAWLQLLHASVSV